MATDDDASRSQPGTDDLLPTRQSLLVRLQDWQDHRSWQEFFDTYWRLIYHVALKAGLKPVEAEEVVQETVLSVAKKMKAFQYDPARGSFKGWLLQLTGWRITNQFNKRLASAGVAEPLADEASETAAAEQVPDPEAHLHLERIWDEEWEQNLIRTATERVRRQVNPRHYQIFDLYVMKQKPVKEIRRFLGVSAMEVYLARHRVGKMVRREVARLKKDAG
ncbi:MAG: sigma-70 family RNA polymerase sigma factor [Verrucomicrobia bacterium]|nr:sigma-70 family RNA polymerase sigma factor [Verrucomicrobiota bacterium]